IITKKDLRFKMQQNGNVSIGKATKNYFTVNKNGNVGIGTDEPEKPLDINGKVRIKDIGALLQLENTNTGHQWELYSGGSVGDNGLGLFDRTHSQYLIAVAGSGNVGIGTANPQYKLDVRGTAHFFKIRVSTQGFSDYVFNDNYKLMSLEELSEFIEINKHLPNIPSEAKVVEEGSFELGEMSKIFLEKIEELTLYIIDLQKQIDELKNNK
ncbi:MAG: hypothetical protein PHP52_14365, partial [Bacteroidales bacterium]|nr:hypothetical protein [Bacteroidales bacterium]